MEARVLVVDDDPNIRALIAVALKRAGFRTESAQDGTAAMARLRTEEFDLVVLDLMMPRMSGWQMLELLRLEPVHALPRIIVVTAAAPHEIEHINSGVTVLTKPFDVHELVSTARHCLTA